MKNGKCPAGQYYCYTNKECRPIPAGFMVDPQGMLRKENGASTVKEEGLRDWFGKSKSKDGKKGWVNVVTGGTCASDEPGEGTPKCVSSAKRASMTKAERLSAQRRKKKADPGQQQKSGAAKPTYVSTDPKKKMNEAKEKDHEYSMARSQLSTVMNAAKRLKKKMAKGEGEVEAWVQSKITKAADYLDSAADYVDSGEMNEAADKPGKGSGKKDACYHKVKSRYKVWPSAYASGALVKCRKKGADNWGNKTEETAVCSHTKKGKECPIHGIEQCPLEVDEAKKCWPGYEKKGTQKLFGKTYNRCVKKEDIDLTDAYGETFATVVDVVKPDPIKTVESPNEWYEYDIEAMTEAVRIPAKTGNIILVTLSWRGKFYMIKMFFPQISKPSRSDVQLQIDKVYPGAKVNSYYISDVKPGEQFLQTEEVEEVEEGLRRRLAAAGAAAAVVAGGGGAAKAGEFSGKANLRVGSTPAKATNKSVSSAVDKALANRGTSHSASSEKGKTGVTGSGSIKYSGSTGSSAKKKEKPEVRSTISPKPTSDSKTSRPKQNSRPSSDRPSSDRPSSDSGSGRARTLRMGDEYQGEMLEDWQSVNRKDKTDGLSQKAVDAYRRENPGSKLKTAVTKDPSKLKKGSKDANRRKSFCSRMKGMKKNLTSAETARDPDSRINKALRRWNCN